RHDVDLFRGMLERSDRKVVAVPVAVAPPVPVPVPPVGAKPRFTESQIRDVLAQAKRGKSITHVCRETGISASTFYRWRSRQMMTGLAESP
ncbi:MAG: transposase, partial [Byssovorax sp.]